MMAPQHRRLLGEGGAKAAGLVDPHHFRTWSQSTTASCSPASSPTNDAVLLPAGQRRKVTTRTRPLQAQRITNTSKDLKTNRKKRLGFGIEGAASSHDSRLSQAVPTARGIPKTALSKTPALLAKPRRAELTKSPGGTDYIITPGRHKICVTDFLASFDGQICSDTCPAMAAAGNYIQGMHREWLEREKQIDSDVFMLSFGDGCAMEEFRQMAVHTVFNYAIEHGIHEKTVHLTVLNISRLIHIRVTRSTQKHLTHELFGCTVIAALRNAIKNDESYEKSDRFRLDPSHVWRSSAFLAPLCHDQSAKRLNEVESECLQLLEEPNNPPLAPEFFERYIEVGAWPSYQDQYRELGAYLMGLALFSSGNSNTLRGTPSSKLAAAALVLAIKVINTDNNNVKYEFWPDRLELYTGYTLESLKPAIRGLAALLRNKPKHSSILEKYYTRWSEYDWN